MNLELSAILLGIVFVSCLTRCVPHSKARQWLLLGASYAAYVYSAGARFLLVLIASSLLNYVLGTFFRRRSTMPLLWLGIGLNFLVLGFFKYLPPLAVQWPGIVPEHDLFRRIIMPLGLSFWTFQGLSYL